MGTTYNLDFLLSVETLNNELIHQTPDDSSRFTQGRSFFYDIKDLRLKSATLTGKGHTIKINMINGNAEVDGRLIYAPPRSLPPRPIELKLIYYRQVQQNSSLTSSLEKDSKKNLIAKISRKDATAPIVRYYMGWQALCEGKNYKWEFGID